MLDPGRAALSAASDPLNVETALAWIARVKPKRAILTNLHIDLDYERLKAELPEGVEPAYDGMTITLPI